MMAGSDFIKTSTGKESINATIPFGIVMCRAIKEYYNLFGYKVSKQELSRHCFKTYYCFQVGLKPAGGIRNHKEAVQWLTLIKEMLGDEWLNPELFRFGASGLLSDLEHNLYYYATGLQPNPCEFTMG